MHKGFCVCASAACRHFWVEIDSQKIDVAREISKFHTPELEFMPTTLSEEISDTTKRVDLEDPKIIEEHERLFDLWTEDHKEFWKTSPSHVRNVRLI